MQNQWFPVDVVKLSVWSASIDNLSLLLSLSCTLGNSWLLKTVMQMNSSSAMKIGGS